MPYNRQVSILTWEYCQSQEPWGGSARPPTHSLLQQKTKLTHRKRGPSSLSGILLFLPQTRNTFFQVQYTHIYHLLLSVCCLCMSLHVCLYMCITIHMSKIYHIFQFTVSLIYCFFLSLALYSFHSYSLKCLLYHFLINKSYHLEFSCLFHLHNTHHICFTSHFIVWSRRCSISIYKNKQKVFAHRTSCLLTANRLDKLTLKRNATEPPEKTDLQA